MSRRASWPFVALVGLIFCALPARAEDVRGRWSFSLGAGMSSTLDDIRNNASVLRLRDPGRGFPDDISDDAVIAGTNDRRQDDLLGRETAIEERQFYNLSVAYGMTSWLSLQVDVGYYEGNVGNLDTFDIDRRFVDLNDDNTLDLGGGQSGQSEALFTPFRDASRPMSLGQLEEIPVMFSAVFRFRKDSPFNPILGAGVGWIFTDFDESDAFRDLNNEILRGFQRVQSWDGTLNNRQIIQDRFGDPLASTTCVLSPDDPGGAQRTDVACAPDQVEPLLQGWDETVPPQLRAQFQPLVDLGLITEEEVDQIIESQRQAELDSLLRSANAAFVPTEPFITAHVDDAFAYQIIGGAEYHFNEHWSAYVLGRYLITRAKLDIRISDNGNSVTGTSHGDETSFETDEARFLFLSESNCNIEGTVLDPCLGGSQIGLGQQPMRSPSRVGRSNCPPLCSALASATRSEEAL
jgi:hypothetical protein